MEQFNGDNGITSKSGSDYVLLGLRPHAWITSLQILFSGMTSVRDLTVSHLHFVYTLRMLVGTSIKQASNLVFLPKKSC